MKCTFVLPFLLALAAFHQVYGTRTLSYNDAMKIIGTVEQRTGLTLPSEKKDEVLRRYVDEADLKKQKRAVQSDYSCTLSGAPTLVFGTTYNKTIPALFCDVYAITVPSGGFTGGISVSLSHTNTLWVDIVPANYGINRWERHHWELQSVYAPNIFVIPACTINQLGTSTVYLRVYPEEDESSSSSYNLQATVTDAIIPIQLTEQQANGYTIEISTAKMHALLEVTPNIANKAVTLEVLFESELGSVIYTSEESNCPAEFDWPIRANNEAFTYAKTRAPNTPITFLAHPIAKNNVSIEMSVSSELVKCGKLLEPLSFCGTIPYEMDEDDFFFIAFTDLILGIFYEFLIKPFNPSPQCDSVLRQYLCAQTFPRCQPGTNFPQPTCQEDCQIVVGACSTLVSQFGQIFGDEEFFVPTSCPTSSNPLEHCYVSSATLALPMATVLIIAVSFLYFVV